jgi:hypothetical protein
MRGIGTADHPCAWSSKQELTLSCTAAVERQLYCHISRSATFRVQQRKAYSVCVAELLLASRPLHRAV